MDHAAGYCHVYIGNNLGKGGAALQKKNVGIVDRWIRIVLGLIFAALAVSGVGGAIGIIVFAILAVAGLWTGITSRCLLYVPFHINTRPRL